MAALERKTSVSKATFPTNNGVAYVIGGGPSLKGFDFSQLAGRPCYGANKGAFDVPWGHLISIDRDFCLNFADQIKAFGGRAHIAPPDKAIEIEGVNFYKRKKWRSAFNVPEDELAGLNSGFAALAKAISDGWENIALLGIDMIPKSGHYHSGYAWNTNQTDGITRTWIEDFERAAVVAPDFGVRIINFSPASAVQGFEKRPLSEIETAFEMPPAGI